MPAQLCIRVGGGGGSELLVEQERASLTLTGRSQKGVQNLPHDVNVFL